MWVAVQGCARRSPTLSEGKSKSGHSCWSWFDQLPCWPPSPMPSDPVPPLWGPRRLHIHTQPLPPAHRTPPPRLLGSRPTLGGHAAGSRPPPQPNPMEPSCLPSRGLWAVPTPTRPPQSQWGWSSWETGLSPPGSGAIWWAWGCQGPRRSGPPDCPTAHCASHRPQPWSMLTACVPRGWTLCCPTVEA